MQYKRVVWSKYSKRKWFLETRVTVQRISHNIVLDAAIIRNKTRARFCVHNVSRGERLASQRSKYLPARSLGAAHRLARPRAAASYPSREYFHPSEIYLKTMLSLALYNVHAYFIPRLFKCQLKNINCQRPSRGITCSLWLTAMLYYKTIILALFSQDSLGILSICISMIKSLSFIMHSLVLVRFFRSS